MKFIRRLSWLCWLGLFVASGALAQKSGTITTSQCVPISVGANVATVAVQISGTWSGTLQPQVALQGQAATNTQVTPSTSTTAQSTITGNGVFTASVAGADFFQVCGNTVASGTANVYLNVSSATRTSIGGAAGGSVSITATSPLTVTPSPLTGTGVAGCATCAIGPGVSTANHLAKFSGTDGVTLADGGAIPAGTVTNSGGSLTANAVVFGAGTNDTKVTAGATSPANGELDLGVASTTQGVTKWFQTTAATFANTLFTGNEFDIQSPGDIGVGLASSRFFKIYSGHLMFASNKGQHIQTQAANNDLAGVVTLSTGAGTHSFTTAYTAAPVCVCTDQTSAAAVQCSTSTATLTVAGTGSDAIAYVCIGNPN